MPDIGNSRKTAEKGAERVTVKQPKNSRKNSRNTRKNCQNGCFSGVSALFFRLFFGCLTVTRSAPFSAVFRLFPMSGIWHLCSWPQRSQPCVLVPDVGLPFLGMFKQGGEQTEANDIAWRPVSQYDVATMRGVPTMYWQAIVIP